MPAYIEAPIGQRFNRLVVHYELSSNNNKLRKMACLCDCGNVATPQFSGLRSGASGSCGCLMRELNSKRCSVQIGDKHPNWKGARKVRPDGYVHLFQPGHPRAHRNHIFEHIAVMEIKLGRRLFPKETVHHINGVKGDNRPENLEVWDHNHGAGQRLEDKMAFYTQEILDKATREELTFIADRISTKLG